MVTHIHTHTHTHQHSTLAPERRQSAQCLSAVRDYDPVRQPSPVNSQEGYTDEMQPPHPTLFPYNAQQSTVEGEKMQF